MIHIRKIHNGFVIELASRGCFIHDGGTISGPPGTNEEWYAPDAAAVTRKVQELLQRLAVVPQFGIDPEFSNEAREAGA